MSQNDDLISRQAAIDALWKALYEYEDKTEKQFQESEDLDLKDWFLHRIFVQNMSDIDRQTILNLPSAQPERLTDDDFETIRIHLSAIKETLCNQQRWEEAEEYQRIIDRFMAFASAQPEKLYTKADYIMALHKEYGCSLTRAEEAHNKALEYLQEEMMMRGGKNERREREGLL